MSAAPISAVESVLSHRQGSSGQNLPPAYAPNNGPAITSVSSAASSVIPARIAPRQRCTASWVKLKIMIAATMPPTTVTISRMP